MRRISDRLTMLLTRHSKFLFGDRRMGYLSRITDNSAQNQLVFFLPFQIVGENPAGFFEKIKRFVFNCIALQNNIEAELKFFSSFEAFQAK